MQYVLRRPATVFFATFVIECIIHYLVPYGLQQRRSLPVGGTVASVRARALGEVVMLPKCSKVFLSGMPPNKSWAPTTGKDCVSTRPYA